MVTRCRRCNGGKPEEMRRKNPLNNKPDKYNALRKQVNDSGIVRLAPVSRNLCLSCLAELAAWVSRPASGRKD
jgi:hypothetical protein